MVGGEATERALDGLADVLRPAVHAMASADARECLVEPASPHLDHGDRGADRLSINAEGGTASVSGERVREGVVEEAITPLRLFPARGGVDLASGPR